LVRVQKIKRLFPDTVPFGLASSLGKPAIEFLNRYFDLMWNGELKPSHGVWAGRWQELEAHAETNASTWMSAMGVRTPTDASLCLLLRYDAVEVHPLVRPTILEAGWYPEHFPSPEATSWCAQGSCAPTGGHPMCIHGTATLPLRAEYVHREVRPKSSWVYAWAWVQPNSVPALSLPSARLRHWDLLNRHYD